MLYVLYVLDTHPYISKYLTSVAITLLPILGGHVLIAISNLG